MQFSYVLFLFIVFPLFSFFPLIFVVFFQCSAFNLVKLIVKIGFLNADLYHSWIGKPFSWDGIGILNKWWEKFTQSTVGLSIASVVRMSLSPCVFTTNTLRRSCSQRDVSSLCYYEIWSMERNTFISIKSLKWAHQGNAKCLLHTEWDTHSYGHAPEHAAVHANTAAMVRTLALS